MTTLAMFFTLDRSSLMGRKIVQDITDLVKELEASEWRKINNNLHDLPFDTKRQK